MRHVYVRNGMRKFLGGLVVCVALTLLVGCSKDEQPMEPNDEKPAFVGQFQSSAHPTSGTASINTDETTLTFSAFKTDSGPNLDIYLVSDLGNIEGDYIDLGDIKGVDGDYTYALPAGTDFTVYKYVVVWCVAVDINFGYAQLIPQ